jgi:hypothetical protein
MMELYLHFLICLHVVVLINSRDNFAFFTLSLNPDQIYFLAPSYPADSNMLLGLIWLGREDDYSLPSNAKIRNEWIYPTGAYVQENFICFFFNF